jgi:hypothetical protein
MVYIEPVESRLAPQQRPNRVRDCSFLVISPAHPRVGSTCFGSIHTCTVHALGTEMGHLFPSSSAPSFFLLVAATLTLTSGSAGSHGYSAEDREWDGGRAVGIMMETILCAFEAAPRGGTSEYSPRLYLSDTFPRRRPPLLVSRRQTLQCSETRTSFVEVCY